MLQRFRKMTQYTVLIFSLIVFPILSLYGIALDVYRPGVAGVLAYQNNLQEIGILDNAYTWPAILTFDWFAGAFSLPVDNIIELTEQFKGVPWTITLFGYTISDPLAVLTVVLADKTATLTFVAGAIIPLVLAIFFGKLFCGWICPMHTLLELNLKLRDFLQKKNIRVRNFSFSRRWKFVVLTLGIIMSCMGMQVFPYLIPYVQLGRNAFYWFFYGSLSFGFLVILLIMVFELVVSERGWCRYFCPSGAFLQLIAKVKLLKIHHDPEKCITGCSKCSKNCELKLNTKASNKPECNNCGMCVSSCPKNALTFCLLKAQN